MGSSRPPPPPPHPLPFKDRNRKSRHAVQKKALTNHPCNAHDHHKRCIGGGQCLLGGGNSTTSCLFLSHIGEGAAVGSFTLRQAEPLLEKDQDLRDGRAEQHLHVLARQGAVQRAKRIPCINRVQIRSVSLSASGRRAGVERERDVARCQLASAFSAVLSLAYAHENVLLLLFPFFVKTHGLAR